MSPKSIALLVVGMVLISGVFVFFHVDYPASPAQITITPPKNFQPPQIYKYENYNKYGLGRSNTSFKDYGNSTVVMQGYARNASNGAPLGNMTMYSAVLSVSTAVRTSSSGFYQIVFLQSGYGKFAFEMFQYNVLYTQNYLPLNATVWNNLSFNPSPKYDISGSTLYNGTHVSDVGLTLSDPWGAYKTSSSSSGQFSLEAVAGNFSITASKRGFSNLTVPGYVNVTDSTISGLKVNLISNNQTGAFITGDARNMLGQRISSYSVYSATTGQYATLSSGEYSVAADFGNNHIGASSEGYQNDSVYVAVRSSPTYYNFTLASENPFKNTIQQPSYTVPQQLSSYFAAYIDNNASHPDYAVSLKTTITGLMKLNGTSGVAASQRFEVLTSVNGTYFVKNITTNANGQYSFNMTFPGQYNFSIISQLSKPFNLSGNLQGGSLLKNLNLVPSSSGIENIHLHTTGLNGSGLSGVNVNITSGTNGPSIYSNYTGGNGNISLNLTSGGYSIHLSKPGYVNKTVSISPGNASINESLTTVSSIGNGTSVWPRSSGLPGTNSSQIQGEMNSTFPTPTTVNYNHSSFILKLMNNSKPISGVQVAVFIYVNSQYYLMKADTNSSGEVTVALLYGGTFTVLPEAMDYNGVPFSVNTSSIPESGHIFTDNMAGKPLFTLKITLQNPYNYSGAAPPSNGMNSSNYLLPATFTSYYQSGSNLTILNYSLPDGNYIFNYTNPYFVPNSIQVNLSSNSVKTIKMEPFLVILNYSSPVEFKISVSGPVPNGLDLSGSGIYYFAEYSGAVSTFIYLGNNLANSTSYTLTDTSPVQTLNLNISDHTVSEKSKEADSNNYVYYNFTFMGGPQKEYLESINYGDINIGANYTLASNGTFVTPTMNGSNSLEFTNYFIIVPGGVNNFSLSYYFPSHNVTLASVNASYLTVNLS